MMVRQINDVEGPVNWQIKAIVDDISSCSVRIGSINFHYVSRKANELGGFRLHIVRDLARKSEPPPVIPSPLPVSVSTNKTVEAPDSNGVVSTPSLAITEPLCSSGRIQSLLDKAADEGLVILQSRKVGFFMRSRTIKRKHAPPSCKEKQIVKEDQVLCYIEQLGCQIPIESDVSSEVIKF